MNTTLVANVSVLMNHEENQKKQKISTLVLKPTSAVEAITESYSDDDEEDLKDYRVGGYHPVEVGEVFAKRYKVLCKLGWGQYSTVWLANDLFSQSLYAIKIQRSSPDYMEAAEYELRIFTRLRSYSKRVKAANPDAVINVVELHDHFYHTGPNGVHMCFVYERLGGSLLDLIKHYRFKGIPTDLVRPLVVAMLSGLAFLHSCRIIHTDLKPENVLLVAPLPPPPPNRRTMYDVIQEHIKEDLTVIRLKKELKEVKDDVKLRYLNNQLRIAEERVKHEFTVNRLPTLWGFIDFNYTAKSTSKQPITTFTPVLTPAKWKYPEDCFYIKMFVLCPRIHLEHAFGERHGFGDKKYPNYSEWTFSFGEDTSCSQTLFQIRGHGVDSHSRLHDLRHILMNDFSNDDKKDHVLWSLRFDGRSIRTVFSILESIIPGFCIIHLPNPKYALSAYEHTLIVNAGKEFLPPETTIFHDLDGVLVALFVPKVREGLSLRPLAERLSMWPSDSIMNKKLSKNRTIPAYFHPSDVVSCKIVDLGNACFDGEQYTEDIQTRQYRCPETLLHLPYSFPADIWSAACVIYELLTGAYLFQPEGETESGRDLDQLSRFEEIAGRIPKDYAEQSPRRREFFKSDRTLKLQRGLKPHTLSKRLIKRGISQKESELVEDLLLKMLRIRPDERIKAEECLKHPWFTDRKSVV